MKVIELYRNPKKEKMLEVSFDELKEIKQKYPFISISESDSELKKGGCLNSTDFSVLQSIKNNEELPFTPVDETPDVWFINEDYLKENFSEKSIEDELKYQTAEFQNIKKRLEREKYKAIDYANEKFALDMLGVLDTLYIAYDMIKNEQEKEGIKNTIDKFNSILKKYNIEEVIYDIFDPEIHSGIHSIESDNHSENEIIDVMQKGYKIKDKILRPAMVSVAK